ncbi:MAG: serine hydrolase domain-containing protein [Pseudomonadota bacterium]
MKRRHFLSTAAGAIVAGATMNANSSARAARFKELDKVFADVMTKHHAPGAAGVVFDRTGVIWSKAYGYANTERREKMTLDSIQNIGSVSKTFTATAAMQLEERGLINLEADVSDYLGFKLRNPNHPRSPITLKQLLTHTSSLRDGDAYVQTYACGDSRLALGPWVEAFFLPGGAYYSRATNFETWGPGEGWKYCNVSWSVVALVVERVSGIPFPAYCRRNIFRHLNMPSTSWLLADIDQDRHSTPYSWIEEASATSGVWGGNALGVIKPDGPTLNRPLASGFHENCLYSHPNYPDGFLRSSANDLSRYLMAYANGGIAFGRRILKAETIEKMLTLVELPGDGDDKNYGLTWRTEFDLGGETAWGHGGRDPGVRTEVAILPQRGAGGVVVANSDGNAPQDAITEMLKITLQS